MQISGEVDIDTKYIAFSDGIHVARTFISTASHRKLWLENVTLLLAANACPIHEKCTDPPYINVTNRNEISAVNLSIGFLPTVRFFPKKWCIVSRQLTPNYTCGHHISLTFNMYRFRIANLNRFAIQLSVQFWNLVITYPTLRKVHWISRKV